MRRESSFGEFNDFKGRFGCILFLAHAKQRHVSRVDDWTDERAIVRGPGNPSHVSFQEKVVIFHTIDNSRLGNGSREGEVKAPDLKHFLVLQAYMENVHELVNMP